MTQLRSILLAPFSSCLYCKKQKNFKTAIHAISAVHFLTNFQTRVSNCRCARNLTSVLVKCRSWLSSRCDKKTQTHLSWERIRMDGRKENLWSSCSLKRVESCGKADSDVAALAYQGRRLVLCKGMSAWRMERLGVFGGLLGILSRLLCCRPLKRRNENTIFYRLIAIQIRCRRHSAIHIR